MRRFLTFLIAVFFSVVSGHDDVIELNKHNFASHTGTGHWFIKFYAPWCGFCKKMAPIWKDLATTVRKEGHPVNIAEFDCTTDSDFCKNNKVTGYPTLQFYARGEYKKSFSVGGGLTHDQLLEFAKEQVINDGTDWESTLDDTGSSQRTFDYKSNLFGFLKTWPTQSYLMNVYLLVAAISCMSIVSCCCLMSTLYGGLDDEEEDEKKTQ